MEKKLLSTDEVVAEIMKIHRSLPARPNIEEVEACRNLILDVEKEDQSRIDAISRQIKGKDVPDELFKILEQMQRSMVYYHSKEQKREALKLLDLENVHFLFDDLVQRAANCVSSPSTSSSASYSRDYNMPLSASASSSGTSSSSAALTIGKTTTSSFYSEKDTLKPSEYLSKDESVLKRASSFRDGIGFNSLSGDVFVKPQIHDSTLKTANSLGQEGEKLSLIKVASLIEVSSKKGTRELNLQGKLLDQVEWLPDSLGKLSSLVTLNLSENRIVVVPETIGGLSTLQTLDLHSNKILDLPESIGDLLNLVTLNLSGNQLRSLRSSMGRLVHLEDLNVSSNSLTVLPEAIGSLVNLKVLNVETNDIGEIPHTIGQCTSLKELRADYNKIKALPEAVGRMGSLEVISVRYNNIRQLPTTMASLLSLRELNVSFNELEGVPESLCFATTLVKLNVSNNFADLKYLPRSIGNLEMLEELDISNNQIRVIPDSFRALQKLRILNAEGNPLEVPPSDVAKMGAQAVVQYMADLVAKRDAVQPVKSPKKPWSCFFSRSSNKRKRGGSGSEYVKT